MRTRMIIIKVPTTNLSEADKELIQKIGLELRTKHGLAFDFGLMPPSSGRAITVVSNIFQGMRPDFAITQEPKLDANTEVNAEEMANFLKQLELGHRDKDILILAEGNVEAGIAHLFKEKEVQILPPTGVCRLVFEDGQPADDMWLDF